jgi:hypothetical protein
MISQVDECIRNFKGEIEERALGIRKQGLWWTDRSFPGQEKPFCCLDIIAA